MPGFLSPGSAFFILGFSWLASAIGFYMYAQKLGRAAESETDGCFLGFACILSAIVGGGVGLLLGRYPYFVITSALGSMLAPGALCWVFVKKAGRKL